MKTTFIKHENQNYPVSDCTFYSDCVYYNNHDSEYQDEMIIPNNEWEYIEEEVEINSLTLGQWNKECERLKTLENKAMKIVYETFKEKQPEYPFQTEFENIPYYLSNEWNEFTHAADDWVNGEGEKPDNSKFKWFDLNVYKSYKEKHKEYQNKWSEHRDKIFKEIVK